MDFSLNDDHLALREAVHRFCESQYPPEHRGNTESQALTTERWRDMAKLGLLGLPFDADFGGSAQGPVEIMLVAHELGRCLSGGLFMSSVVLAGQLLARVGTAEQCNRWLPPLSLGDLQIALALYEEGVRYTWTDMACQATLQSGQWFLNGIKTMVFQGDTADLFLVAARTSGQRSDLNGLTLFVVDANADGVQVLGFDTLDGRRAARVHFTSVAVRLDNVLGSVDEAFPVIDAAIDGVTAALCAEAVGAVEVLMELTCEHLRSRQQFGVALAKFQALQHRVADMAIALEQVKSMACAAAMAINSSDPHQRRRLVSAAKVIAQKTGREAGLWAIQMHGAMGMTDECRIGHYAKRLLVIGQSFGDTAYHLERFSEPQS